MIQVFRSVSLQQKVLAAYDDLLTLWDLPVEQFTVATDYGETHVVGAGDKSKPPLVLFHGDREHTALAWLSGAKALSRDFYLLGVDRLGCPGKTVPGVKYRTLFDPVRWIHQVLEFFSLEEASFLGTGKGGYLVQLYAAVAPRRVKKAAVLSEPLAVQAPLSRRFQVARNLYPWVSLPQGAGMARITQRLGGKTLRERLQNPMLLQQYRLVLRSHLPSAHRYLTLRQLNPSEIDIVKENTIFFVGTSDPLAYHPGAKAMFQRYETHLITFEGAGHFLHHEIPSLLFPLVRHKLQHTPIDS